MLPRRPLRLLWDASPPGAVVLSGFRSRDPEEEGGEPRGRGVGQGGGQQEDEEEEEEEDEVSLAEGPWVEEDARWTLSDPPFLWGGKLDP